MNAFPPYALLDARAVEDAADKTRRLERLYDMTRERACDGKAVLHELIEKHGPPGSGMDPELRASLSRVMTVLLWGELAAWNISADLALEIEDVDAKMAATAQVFDEARHFTVLAEYLEHLGRAPTIGAIPRQLLRKVLGAPTLATKLIGMQLLFETNAVVIFRRVGESGMCPILTELLPYFERDESRHVGLGVLYVPKLIERMSSAEARRTARFQVECILLLMASGFTFREDFTRLDLEPRQMAERVTKMQDEVVRQMVDAHGKGVLRALMNPRAGFGPKIVDWIHPEGGLDSVTPWHRGVHQGLTRALTRVDRAFS